MKVFGLLVLWVCSTQARVDVWLTVGDESKKLSQEESIEGGDWNDVEWTISVDRNDRDQAIKGFGAALSNSAASLLYHSPNKAEVLDDLFGSSGIGISYIRLVMGGSDFNAVEPYTYDDVDGSGDDFDMEQFSIAKDQEFVIPVLRDILAINPDIRIMASPWSAPAWMKNPRSLNGGRLRQGSDILEALAEYFLRFVQAYAAEGISIDAVTLQNEPEHASGGYPTMLMGPDEQADLIKFLGPKFRDAGVTTEIVLWDHNWDNPGYSLSILSDSEARQYVGGSGWHCYAGDKNAPLEVKEAHPDKDLYFTECSGGEWDSDFGSGFGWNLQTLFIGQSRIGARTVLLWNLALDENHGPRVGVTSGCEDCRGVLTVPSWGGFDRNVEFYSIGHFSKFVRPGAVKIGSNNFGDNLESVAFENPDGRVVVVVLNTWWDGEKSFQVMIDGQFYRVDNFPGRSAVTLVQN